MDADRTRWDTRWSDRPVYAPEPPPTLGDHLDLVPSRGRALDVACGQGTHAVWLAWRGLEVVGVDVSPVAITRARELAAHQGVAGRCTFVVADLDHGLPVEADGDYAVVLCHRFRDPKLYPLLRERLSSPGVLAVTVLSRVGRPASDSSFLAEPGEAVEIAGDLDVVHLHEGGGEAEVVARRPPPG